jgi:hypothetical protein
MPNDCVPFPNCDHPATDENTYLWHSRDGVKHRTCRTCKQAKMNERNERRRLAAAPRIGIEPMAFCQPCASGDCHHDTRCTEPVVLHRQKPWVSSGVCSCGSAWSVRWPVILAAHTETMVTRNRKGIAA